MEVLILGLITSLIVISLIPTTKDKQRNIQEFRELFPCKPHTWVDKPSGLDDGSTYRVCKDCKLLPGVEGNYEV